MAPRRWRAASVDPLSTTITRTGTPWCWNASMLAAHRSGWFQCTSTTVTGAAGTDGP